MWVHLSVCVCVGGGGGGGVLNTLFALSFIFYWTVECFVVTFMECFMSMMNQTTNLLRRNNKVVLCCIVCVCVHVCVWNIWISCVFKICFSFLWSVQCIMGSACKGLSLFETCTNPKLASFLFYDYLESWQTQICSTFTYTMARIG